MKIIPAIDIIDGKCVRLSKGDYAQKTIYSASPLEVAKQFEDAGINYLHLVDLDGAKQGRIVNTRILESIATNTGLKIDFGGGLRSTDDVKMAFNSGADQITGGSIAARNPALFNQWLEAFGPNKIILGADCKTRKIATNGWHDTTSVDVIDFIKNYETQGVQRVICTDIAKDGMLSGPSTELYKEILATTSIDLVASGGVSTIEDLKVLKAIGCKGAIVGKAIYENKITLKELTELC